METCGVCENGTAREIVADRAVVHDGELKMVRADRFMQCDNCACHAEYFTDEQSREHAKKYHEL